MISHSCIYVYLFRSFSQDVKTGAAEVVHANESIYRLFTAGINSNFSDKSDDTKRGVT